MRQWRLAARYFATWCGFNESSDLVGSMTWRSRVVVMGTWPVDLAPAVSWREQFEHDPFVVCDGALKLYTLPACVGNAFEEGALGPM